MTLVPNSYLIYASAQMYAEFKLCLLILAVNLAIGVNLFMIMTKLLCGSCLITENPMSFGVHGVMH